MPILFTIINDMITDDEYLASKQGITLGDLSDERNLIDARNDFQLRVLNNSLTLYPVLLTFHVIAREKGSFFYEEISVDYKP